jgi:hypothetical protein
MFTCVYPFDMEIFNVCYFFHEGYCVFWVLGCDNDGWRFDLPCSGRDVRTFICGVSAGVSDRCPIGVRPPFGDAVGAGPPGLFAEACRLSGNGSLDDVVGLCLPILPLNESFFFLICSKVEHGVG